MDNDFIGSINVQKETLLDEVLIGNIDREEYVNRVGRLDDDIKVVYL